jgi:hypothetical protein
MTRESIVTRLLDQGHITIQWADILLNKKESCIERITELHTDCNISTIEVVFLINENKPTPGIQYQPTYTGNEIPPILCGTPAYNIPYTNYTY